MTKEMVLIPTDDQFDEKTDELMLGECYWTIPMYPKDRDKLIGSKIYFYDKVYNRIILRATITGFEEREIEDEWSGQVSVKKTVLFQLEEGDKDFKLDLENKGIEKRKQTRGWCYRFW